MDISLSTSSEVGKRRLRRASLLSFPAAGEVPHTPLSKAAAALRDWSFGQGNAAHVPMAAWAPAPLEICP